MLEVRRVLFTMGDNIWNHRPSEFFWVFAPLPVFVVLSGGVLTMGLEAAWRLTAYLLPFIGTMHLIVGVAGGTFAGFIIGPIGAWYFGRKHLPIANPCASAFGAIPGLVCIVLIMAWSESFSC